MPTFIKMFLRTLRREKSNTIISLTGLVIGLTASISILLYNDFESHYDNFHPNRENIYRLVDEFKNAGNTTTRATVFYALADAVKAEVPGVENTTSAFQTDAIFRKDDRIFQEQNLLCTSASFFEIFSIPMIHGDYKAISEVNTIILSEDLARKYFGKSDPIGETLEVEGQAATPKILAKVIGVFKSIPPNSHLKASAFLSMKNVENTVKGGLGNQPFEILIWRWTSFHTYVQIAEGADPVKVGGSIKELSNRYRADLNKQLNQEHTIMLQPLLAIHNTVGLVNEMTPVTNMKYILIFYSIAALILAMAWINYINLSTARAVKRAKEIGLRKVLGAERKHLILQLLSESFFLNICALLVAFALLMLGSPWIEAVVNKSIFFAWDSNYYLIGFILTAVVAGSFLSGVYPALTLTSYEPTSVLKGKFKYSPAGVWVRKSLVAFQFFIALGLFMAVFIVSEQLDFMMNASIGVNIDNRIYIRMPNSGGAADYTSKVETLKTELQNTPGVKTASVSSVIPGVLNPLRSTTQLLGRTEKGNIFPHLANIDEDHIDFFEMKLIAGRKFSKDIKGREAIVNRKTVTDFGFNTPEEILEEKLGIAGGGEVKVVGVIENFNQLGLQYTFEPMVFIRDTTLSGSYLTVNLEGENLNASLQQVKKKFESLFPEAPYAFNFLDDTFRTQYGDDQRFQQIFSFFTTVALSIACLGLLGLSTFMMAQKDKEVSIRKVLGASTFQIFSLLNREYIILSALSFVAAAPLAYYLLNNWLDYYHNRISIQGWMMFAPLFILMLVILAVTSKQTYKTANANPTKSLKED